MNILRKKHVKKITKGIKIDMNQFLQIKNDHKKLTKTNYWEMETAKKGLFFLSTNSGCIRLLCPPGQVYLISEMRTGKVVIISKGFWEEKQKDGIEIMFEDYSDSPFAIKLSIKQCDMLPKDGKNWEFALYTEEGIIFRKKCKVRTVQEIPYMKEWGK